LLGTIFVESETASESAGNKSVSSEFDTGG
jgi:hypothetical protein